MSVKDAYRKEMEVELEVAQMKLKMLKALTSSLKKETSKAHSAKIDALEKKAHVMRAKLRDLDGLQGKTWQQLQGEVEQIWTALQTRLHDAVIGFELNK